jgi:hypothetical protein
MRDLKNMDDAGWLELIENIVFPWFFSDEPPEENRGETYDPWKSRDL